MAITSLAWELRHVDIIIANNPPMQIVAALTKFFVSRVQTIWWHHHIPWYSTDKSMSISLLTTKFWKGMIERMIVIPRIDQMIATSYFVAEKIQMYCGREAMVIHPVIEEMQKEGSMVLTQIPDEPLTLFTHGRLEVGKGIDMIIRVWERLKKENNSTNLLIFGTGSLEKELREKDINVQPFDRKNTFRDILSGQY